MGQTAHGAAATAPEAFYSSRPPSTISGGSDSYYDARYDVSAPSYLPGGGDAFYDTTWDEALPRNDIPNHQPTTAELADNQASYDHLREATARTDFNEYHKIMDGFKTADQLSGVLGNTAGTLVAGPAMLSWQSENRPCGLVFKH